MGPLQGERALLEAPENRFMEIVVNGGLDP